MENFGQEHCRLCLSVKKDEHFEEIEDITRNILNVLLLKLNFENQTKHVMCKLCSLKLMEAFKFKLMCLHTDTIIIPYVHDETGFSVDLREIYVKQKGNKLLNGTLDEHKVCRLCMQVINGRFILAHEIEANMLEKYIPEIRLDIVKDPVMCVKCFDSFNTHSNFIKDCLKVTEKIEDLPNIGVSGYVSQEPSLDSRIQFEEIFIKSEESEPEKEFTKIDSTPIKPEDLEVPVKIEYSEIKLEDEDKDSISSLETNESNSAPEANLIEQQKEMMDKNQFTPDQLTPKNPLKMHKCDICGRECDKCDCENKHEGNLKKYQLKLKYSPKSVLYKCNSCKYETKKKQYFTRHQLVHKNPLQAHMYTCESCDFISNYKSTFKRHRLTHATHSDMEVHKCAVCDFKTKYKYNLRQHRLIHGDPSKVGKYKCNSCDFTIDTKYKLVSHQLEHRAPSKMTMYMCDSCDFMTSFKSRLTNHKLKHEGPSELPMFECHLCNFKTKYKNNLRSHLLRHKGL